MGGIFISYRREDSIAYAGRLYDRLQAYFGKEQVFMDVDTLKPGEDFVDKLQSAVASCDVLIAVIGTRWLTETDQHGGVRILNPEDFVHLEIVAALERGIRVIPALVGGAHMPLSTSLPDPLKKLARRQAITIPDIEFHQSVSSLIESLESAIKDNQEQHSKEIKADSTQAAPLQEETAALLRQFHAKENTSVAKAKTGKATAFSFHSAASKGKELFCGALKTFVRNTVSGSKWYRNALTSVPMPVLLACIGIMLTIAIFPVWPTGRSNDRNNLRGNTQPVVIPPETKADPPVADIVREDTKTPPTESASDKQGPLAEKQLGSVEEDQASSPTSSNDQARSPKPSDAAEKSTALIPHRNAEPIRVGGNVIATHLISQVKPTYPALAKTARVQGVVVLEAKIDKDGSVATLKVLSGHPLLVQAAIDGVKQWRYTPTISNGEPVAVVTTIAVNFAFRR